VSLLARDDADLVYYPPKMLRYSFASLMAKCWFTMISKLSKKDMDVLIKDMSNKTFVGEYIGNVNC
jgi:hypothetical protein